MKLKGAIEMSKPITVYQVNNKYYLNISNQLKEIDAGIVHAWWSQDEDVNIIIGEGHV
jgi:hypothetical protein